MRKKNMYPWVDNNFNPIKGKCEHDCVYCYMKKFPQGELRLDEKILKASPITGKTYFVCSGTDLFQNSVPAEWIRQVLAKLNNHTNCKFLLQTKNPFRMFSFVDMIEPHMILCVTIESDLDHGVSKAPSPTKRATAIEVIKNHFPQFQIMITIEPIMKFSSNFIDMLCQISPDVINIGANSSPEIQLPESSSSEVLLLIEKLKCKLRNTKINTKKNLRRIIVDEGKS